MSNERMDSTSSPQEETRQERREKKLKKKRERIPQHGKSLAKVYRDVVEKQGKK